MVSSQTNDHWLGAGLAAGEDDTGRRHAGRQGAPTPRGCAPWRRPDLEARVAGLPGGAAAPKHPTFRTAAGLGAGRTATARFPPGRQAPLRARRDLAAPPRPSGRPQLRAHLAARAGDVLQEGRSQALPSKGHHGLGGTMVVGAAGTASHTEERDAGALQAPPRRPAP